MSNSEHVQTLKAEAETLRSAGAISLRDKEINKGESKIIMVNPYILTVKDGWNNRDLSNPSNAEHIETLARSIAAIGVKEPLTVYPEDGNLVLSDGHCRLQATIKAIEEFGAEIKAIPVKTESRNSNEADRLFSQVVRNSGKQLEPLEMARVFRKLNDFGWSNADIAQKSGLTQTRVIQLLELQSAPSEVQDMIRNGDISATLAYQTMKQEGNGEKAATVLREALEHARGLGKDKATAKHVDAIKTAEKQLKPKGDAKPSFKTRCKEIYEDVKRTDIEDDGKGPVHITLTREDWLYIREELGL